MSSNTAMWIYADYTLIVPAYLWFNFLLIPQTLSCWRTHMLNTMPGYSSLADFSVCLCCSIVFQALNFRMQDLVLYFLVVIPVISWSIWKFYSAQMGKPAYRIWQGARCFHLYILRCTDLWIKYQCNIFIKNFFEDVILVLIICPKLYNEYQICTLVIPEHSEMHMCNVPPTCTRKQNYMDQGFCDKADFLLCLWM